MSCNRPLSINSIFRLLALITCLGGWLLPTTLAAEPAWPAPPRGSPYHPPARCNGSSAPVTLRANEAQYPVCADQRVVFATAVAEAAKANKLLIVDFGATWCPWCRSLQGQFAAGTLADPDKYVVVEIALSTTTADGRRDEISTGYEVLSGILTHRPEVKLRAVPFLAMIDPARPSRTVARNLDDLESEKTGQHLTDKVRTIIQAATLSIEQGTPAPKDPSWIAKKLTRLWNRVRGV
jgi:thiol-disulfide isomerase/thioredoxin